MQNLVFGCNALYFPSTFGDDDLLQGMTGDTKLLIYIRKGWCFAGCRELFLVRVGERPKAPLLRKGCMGSSADVLGMGRCEAKDSVAGKKRSIAEQY